MQLIKKCNQKNVETITNEGVEYLNENLTQLYKNDVRINDVRSVNRLLQRIVNALLKDEITEAKARTIGYLANIMITGFKAGELEDRITELEESIKKAV